MSESSDADGQSSESGAGTRSDDESDDEAVVAQPVAAPARRHRRRIADVRLARRGAVPRREEHPGAAGR